MLVSANVSLPGPEGVRLVPVTTGAEMLDAVRDAFPRCDALVMTAAVCDFRPRHYEPEKRKKDGAGMTVEFEPVADILKTVAAGKTPRQTVAGPAGETRTVEDDARKRLAKKTLAPIAANFFGRGGAFAPDKTPTALLGRAGPRKVLGPAAKTELGKILVAEIENFRRGRHS